MKYWLDKKNRIAFEHARQATAHHSKSFYLAARLLPAEKRWATFAVYGYCRYVDNLIDNQRTRHTVEIERELEFLVHELEAAYRTGESEHPIIQPFIVAALRYGIPIKHPLDLISGVRMDLRHVRYETFEELYPFCYKVAAVVGLMMTHIFGYSAPGAFAYAEKLGIAMQLTNILRDIQEDRRMGRIYLPLQELHAYDCAEQNILAEQMTPGFRELMAFQVNRAHSYYDAADAGIALLQEDARFAVYAASRIYRGILRRIESRDYNPFLGRVYVPKHTKLSIVLEEALRTKMLAAHGGLTYPVDLS